MDVDMEDSGVVGEKLIDILDDRNVTVGPNDDINLQRRSPQPLCLNDESVPFYSNPQEAEKNQEEEEGVQRWKWHPGYEFRPEKSNDQIKEHVIVR